MKTSIKYLILVLLFIFLIIIFTLTKLYIGYSINGSFKYTNNYYEIKYSNVIMDDNNISVEMNEDNSIYIKIPELRNETNISIDINNIGSKDIMIDNYQIINIDTPLDKNNVIVNASLVKGYILKGGTSKKMLINIKNANKDSGYYYFSINTIYKES